MRHKALLHVFQLGIVGEIVPIVIFMDFHPPTRECGELFKQVYEWSLVQQSTAEGLRGLRVRSYGFW